MPLLLENVPASHAAHSDEPLIAENLPALHSVQAADPFSGFENPARHGRQTPPSSPANPALQMHPVTLPDPSNEFELAGQCWHEELIACENLPASHAVQVVVPLLLENVPASHAAHSDEPLIAENLPALHSVQAADPFSGFENPARHGRQTPEKVPIHGIDGERAHDSR